MVRYEKNIVNRGDDKNGLVPMDGFYLTRYIIIHCTCTCIVWRLTNTLGTRLEGWQSVLYVTGSRKTRLLEQTKILVINVPSDRAEHCLHNDMLSVHIPSYIPELCALETRSRKM